MTPLQNYTSWTIESFLALQNPSEFKWWIVGKDHLEDQTSDFRAV